MGRVFAKLVKYLHIATRLGMRVSSENTCANMIRSTVGKLEHNSVDLDDHTSWENLKNRSGKPQARLSLLFLRPLLFLPPSSYSDKATNQGDPPPAESQAFSCNTCATDGTCRAWLASFHNPKSRGWGGIIIRYSAFAMETPPPKKKKYNKQSPAYLHCCQLRKSMLSLLQITRA